MGYNQFRIKYDEWRQALRRNEPGMWHEFEGQPCPHFVTTKAGYAMYVTACQQDRDQLKAALYMV